MLVPGKAEPGQSPDRFYSLFGGRIDPLILATLWRGTADNSTRYFLTRRHLKHRRIIPRARRIAVLSEYRHEGRPEVCRQRKVARLDEIADWQSGVFEAASGAEFKRATKSRIGNQNCKSIGDQPAIGSPDDVCL